MPPTHPLSVVFLLTAAAVVAIAAAPDIEIHFDDVQDGAVEIGSIRDRLPPELAARFPRWPDGQSVSCQLDLSLIDARLSVDSRGNVRAYGGIDREKVCSPSSALVNCSSSYTAQACTVSGHIRVQDLTRPDNYLNVLLRLSIADIDNKPPQFSSPYPAPYRIRIAENAPLGLRSRLPTAKDLDDSGLASCRLTYSLVNCSPDSRLTDPPLFRLVFDTPLDTGRPAEPWLELAKQLDAERTDSYRLCVTAADPLGSGRFTATLTVSVEVLDVNDNAPTWSPGQAFSVSVPESNPPEVLLRLSAIDADRNFGLVSYRLLRQHRLFRLDNRGELRLRALNGLDYEQPSGRQHRLVVAAFDNGADGDVKSVTATLTVNVLDSNDNPPEILVLNRDVELAESGPTPLLVQRIFVSDRDSGRNSMVACELVRPSGMFELSLLSNASATGRVEYALRLIRQLDWEAAKRHRADVRCVDAGEPPLSSEVSILVRVRDLNDNAPVFVSPPLFVAVDEATPVGTMLHQFSVEDPDSDRHRLRVDILGDGADRFRVEARGLRTFALVLARPLDREARDSFNLTARLIDFHGDSAANATEAHRAAAGLFVRVLDSNDCAPKFDSEFAFDTPENASVGAIIGRVAAADADLGENGTVVYSLASANSFFIVDANTGDIRVARQLDRDGPRGIARHLLRVRAADQGRPFQRSTETDVLVAVVDCNDNRPRFVRPAGPARPVVVACDAAVAGAGLPVGQPDLAVEDADSTPENRRVRYRLAGPARPAGPHEFAVVPESGRIYLTRAPRPCQPGVYRLSLECYEPSSASPQAPALPGAASRITVTIAVSDTDSTERREQRQGPLPESPTMQKPPLSTNLTEEDGVSDGGDFSYGLARTVAVPTLLTSAVVLLALLLIALVLRLCGKGRVSRSGHIRYPGRSERTLKRLSISSPRPLLLPPPLLPPTSEQPPQLSNSQLLIDEDIHKTAVGGLAQRQFSRSFEADAGGNKYQSCASERNFQQEMTERGLPAAKSARELSSRQTSEAKRGNAYQTMLPYSPDRNLYATCSPQPLAGLMAASTSSTPVCSPMTESFSSSMDNGRRQLKLSYFTVSDV